MRHDYNIVERTDIVRTTYRSPAPNHGPRATATSLNQAPRACSRTTSTLGVGRLGGTPRTGSDSGYADGGPGAAARPPRRFRRSSALVMTMPTISSPWRRITGQLRWPESSIASRTNTPIAKARRSRNHLVAEILDIRGTGFPSVRHQVNLVASPPYLGYPSPRYARHLLG